MLVTVTQTRQEMFGTSRKQKAKVHPESLKTTKSNRQHDYDSDCSSSVHSDNRINTARNDEDDEEGEGEGGEGDLVAAGGEMDFSQMQSSKSNGSMKGSSKLAQQHNAIRERIVQEVIGEILPDMGSYASGTYNQKVIVEDSFTTKWFKIIGCITMDLHDAVLSGSVDEVKRAIKKICVGPKARPEMINAYNQDGQTALSLAAKIDNTIMCLELIENHAIVECPDESTGRTPLYYSVQNRNVELTTLLLANGAKANTGDLQCVTALMVACITDDYKHIKLLCAAQADVDLQDERGWTALHYAVVSDSQRCLAVLLSEGANRELRDINKRKPLHFARFHEFGNCIAMLEEPATMGF